jgi:hypothetical protein
MMGKWKMRIVGRASRENVGFVGMVTLGKGPTTDKVVMRLRGSDTRDLYGFEIENKQLEVPVNVQDRVWVYRNTIVQVDSPNDPNPDELALRIKHLVLKQDKGISKIKREVEALENTGRVSSPRRERIPDDVRMFVWQRDEGRCFKCGARERLEFDHIIPVVEGGSNTARNIQLLCEICNRQKGKCI